MRVVLWVLLAFATAASAQEPAPPAPETWLPRVRLWIGSTTAANAGLGTRLSAGAQLQAERWIVRGEMDVTDMARPNLTFVRGEVGRWFGPFELALGGWASMQDCSRPRVYDDDPCERIPLAAASALIAYGDPATMKRVEFEVAFLLAPELILLPHPARAAVRWPVFPNLAIGAELQYGPRIAATAEVRYRLQLDGSALEFGLGGGLSLSQGPVIDPASGFVVQAATEFQW